MFKMKPIKQMQAPKVLTYETSYADPSNGTSYTFSSSDIGDAAWDRRVIVGVSQTGDGIPNGVTVGGIDADLLVGADAGNSRASLWIALVPTGTTADIVVTGTGGTISRMGIGVWSCTGLKSNTPVDTDSETVSNPQNLSVTTEDGGFVVAVSNARRNGTTVVTWTNLTERYDENIETNASSQSGADEVTDGTTLSSTVTFTGGTLTRCCCIASF